MKFDERKPDKTEVLTIAQHSIVVDTFGSGENVLLCLNGGPGLPCNDVIDPDQKTGFVLFGEDKDSLSYYTGYNNPRSTS